MGRIGGSSTERPEAVRAWMKNHRNFTPVTPYVTEDNLREHIARTKTWWIAIQPPSRRSDDDASPLRREAVPAAEWAKFGRKGKDGAHVFLLALLFWMEAVEEDGDELQALCHDFAWACDAAVAALQVHAAPPGVLSAASPNKTQSVKNAGAKSGGKRKVAAGDQENVHRPKRCVSLYQTCIRMQTDFEL